jgi:hypothetical protein
MITLQDIQIVMRKAHFDDVADWFADFQLLDYYCVQTIVYHCPLIALLNLGV